MKATPKGNKLYKIDGYKPNGKYITTQDSSKQDYIFCPECELAFNDNYERYTANTFYKSYQSKTNFFNVHLVSQRLRYKVYTNTDYVTFQKFWLLQLYRAHVSTLDEFIGFKLAPSHLTITHKNLFDTSYFEDIQITVLSTDFQSDKTNNVVLAVPNKKESYTIWMNEFICIYQFNPNLQLIPELADGSNYLSHYPRVIFLDEQSWINFRHVTFALAANNSVDNLNLD
jgi:hypothetical protein